MAVLGPTVWCDPCIAPLIRALNDGGLSTVASCCGHGRTHGSVCLADGRELVIRPFLPYVAGPDFGGTVEPGDFN